MRIKITVLSLMMLVVLSLSAQDIHLFQSHLQDGKIFPGGFAEGYFQYGGYENISTMNIGVQGGYAILPNLEIDGRWGFISWNPEEGDGESGLSDLLISTRYGIMQDIPEIAAGAYITLPIGEEKIGQEHLNFGVFGAIRYLLNEQFTLTGKLSLDFIETIKYSWDSMEEETEYENSLGLGIGSIIALNEKIALVPEMAFQSEGDYALLSCGADYSMMANGKIRAMLGLGLDDGAPDILLQLGYLFGF